MNKDKAIQLLERLQDPDYYQITSDAYDAIQMAIEALKKQIQSEESFEWCTDCKEYDQEKHCCHRFSKIINQTLDEVWNNMPPLKEELIPGVLRVGHKMLVAGPSKAGKGRLSQAQKRWIDVLTQMGYKCVVAHGWNEAREALEQYLNDTQ